MWTTILFGMKEALNHNKITYLYLNNIWRFYKEDNTNGIYKLVLRLLVKMLSLNLLNVANNRT
jgi:hypothetical protein